MTKPKAALEFDDGLGPAMRELTEKQRKYVQVYIERPLASHTAVARAAGYSTGGKSGIGIRYESVRLLRSERVLRAINEELDKRFRGDAAIGRAVLLEIVADKSHPHRLRAAEALLGRAGFPLLSEQKISVTHTDLTGPAMTERITALCLELSLDPQKLLGSAFGQGRHPPNVTTIEGETIEGEVVAAPATRASRYIQRMMVPEYEKVGWVAPPDSVRDHSAEDMVEIVWKHAGEPRVPDTRPMSAGLNA